MEKCTLQPPQPDGIKKQNVRAVLNSRICKQTRKHMNPKHANMIARMSLALKSDGDWKDFYELYHDPIIKAAQLAAFSPGECQEIFRETLLHMVKRGFKDCLSNPSQSVTDYLSCAAYRCAQRASERRKIGGEVKDANTVFGSGEIPERKRFQEFVFQGVAKRILEAFIERGLFSDTMVRSVHAFLVGAPMRRNFDDLHKVGASLNEGEDEACNATVEALMIIYRSIEAGASLDEAFLHFEMTLLD
jgi:hypothetical protein